MTSHRPAAAFTLIETLVSMVIMLLCMGIIVPMIHATGQIWTKTGADTQNKELLSRALLKMSPTLRNALQVDTVNSAPHKLVIILPAVDSTTKTYAYPVANGDSVIFYLSDKTGALGKTGTILWKAVNGVPDAGWSLRSGKGAIDFGNSNLSFSFDNNSDPGTVTITAYSTVWAGKTPASATSCTTVLLRNHQLCGL